MRMRTVAGFFVTATIAACSLTTALDGFTGGTAPDASAAADATTDVTVGADASVVDSALPPDAREGGPVDPCVGAVLCDDFERDLVQGNWGSLYENEGGTLKLDPTTSTSPTKSLAMHVPASGDPHAQLYSIDYPNVAHVRAAFSMKTGAPDRQLALFRIQLAANSRAGVFDLFMLPNRFVADEQVFGSPSAGYFDYPIQSGFKPNVWQRWSFELDATVMPALGIVTLDGVEVIRKQLTNTYAKGRLNVYVGAFYAPDGPVRDVSYDDVSITILP
jgi:hypothetical protein